MSIGRELGNEHGREARPAYSLELFSELFTSVDSPGLQHHSRAVQQQSTLETFSLGKLVQ